MPIYNDLALGMLKERYEQIINDYINGTDTVDVFKARIYGLGYRGAELIREVEEYRDAMAGVAFEKAFSWRPKDDDEATIAKEDK